MSRRASLIGAASPVTADGGRGPTAGASRMSPSVSSPRSAAPALLVLAAALVANLLLEDERWHLGLAAAGLAALLAPLARGRGFVRGLLPLLWPVVLGAVAMWLGARAGLDEHSMARTFARSFAGATWSLWFAKSVRWRELRSGLLRLRAPTALVELVDGALAQGALFRRELERKRQAAVVRLGWSSFHRRCANGGALLAGAVARSLMRADRLEEALALRAASSAGFAAESLSSDGTALRLTDVHIHAGGLGRPRLAGVSLCLDLGSWVVLAGASGAGKSTLLRTIAGLEAPDAGVLARFGEKVRGANVAGRVDARVSLVFQDPDDQFFASDVLEDLCWGLTQRGVTGQVAEARALTMLRAMELEHLAGREVATLSFGERKRVALAAALVTEPALLLCDEPTMGLDETSARLVIDAVLAQARRLPMTVVWATHELGHLPPPASELWLLEGGRVAYRGPLTSPAAEAALRGR